GERVCHYAAADVVLPCAGRPVLRADLMQARGPPDRRYERACFTTPHARLSNQLEVGLMSHATIDERSDEKVSDDRLGISRRNILRAGAVGVAAVGLGAGKVLMQPSLQNRGLLTKDGVFHAGSIAFADSLYD